MKSIKVVLIATIVAFAMVSTSLADGFHAQPKKVLNCTLMKACQCPSLIQAILVQVDKTFLNNNQQYYTVEVICNNIVYRITGTRAQWIWFYNQEWSVNLSKTVELMYDD